MLTYNPFLLHSQLVIRGALVVIRSKTSKQEKSHRTSDNIETEEEYVLDKAPPSYTLAQRLGLVGAPPHLLNEHSWKAIKESSNTRHDSSLPCPICQEPFNNLSTLKLKLL